MVTRGTGRLAKRRQRLQCTTPKKACLDPIIRRPSAVENVRSHRPLRSQISRQKRVERSEDVCSLLSNMTLIAFQNTAKRILRHVAVMGSANPNIWRKVDEVRAADSRGSASWPAWCFVPASAVAAVAREFPAIAQQISLFEGLAAWRPGQGIYIFDPLLADELSRTVTDEPIPGEVLLRLPEWCIYITVTEGAQAKWGLNGVFAFLSYDDAKSEAALRFLLDMSDDDLLATFPICLNTGSVQESVERAAAEAGHALATAGKGREFDELSGIDIEQCSRLLAPFVNLVLYVCSANADIVDSTTRQTAPRRPVPIKTRRGVRMFPPDEVAFWEVGFRVATSVRHARDQMERATSERGEVRPHLRRAHWHAFWTGSRSAPGSRALRIRWLPPILVRAEQAGTLPNVRIIRPTRKLERTPDVGKKNAPPV